MTSPDASRYDDGMSLMHKRRCAALVLALLVRGGVADAADKHKDGKLIGVPVGRITFVERTAERAAPGGSWDHLKEGDSVRVVSLRPVRKPEEK